MTLQPPKRRSGQHATAPQPPQLATEADIKRLAEAAKFWDDPHVKALLAERERQERAAQDTQKKGQG